MEIRRADGAAESFHYDYAGNITLSVDANGNETQYEYNCTGQLSRMTDPLGNSEYYWYDTGNRLNRMRDRNGTETTYTYNMYGSLMSRAARNPSKPDETVTETYQYTPEGRLHAAISATGMRYSYEYDIMGRLARKTASGRELLTYAYDLNGNLVRQKDITGKITEYAYNALDLLENVTDNGNRVAEYTYYPDGTVKSIKNGSLYTEYAYDTDRNLTGLKTHLGTELLVDNHYRYDNNGNRIEKRQLGGETTRYGYDALNQLTKVQYPSHTEELHYDSAGNRTRRVSGGMEELYAYDPRNRLTEYTKGGKTTTFTYDRAGNLLSDDKARYTYDAFNRTEKVETFDGHVQINRYDAEGLRHEMEEDGRLVQFIFRGDEIAAEENDGGIIRYIRGYDLIASDAESARTYYHYASDEMSSITHVVDGTNVLNHYEYDAWGDVTVCEEKVENRFRFNGQQYDPVTQQYYLRARYYNPVIARFTQEDDYWGAGLNLYVYCWNNPVQYMDPSGNTPRECVQKAFQRIREEHPELSAAEAHKLALKEAGKPPVDPTIYVAASDLNMRYGDLVRALDSGDFSSVNDRINPIVYATANDLNMRYGDLMNKLDIGNLAELQVIAVYEQNGQTYYDVNARARNGKYKSDTVIQNPNGQKGLSNTNNTMAKAHAEIGAMNQALSDPNLPKGGAASLRVYGEATCRFCQSDVKKMALNLNLDLLVVDSLEVQTSNKKNNSTNKKNNVIKTNPSDIIPDHTYRFDTGVKPKAFYNNPKGGLSWQEAYKVAETYKLAHP